MLPVESSPLIPLLETFRYKEAQIFKQHLDGTPLKWLLAEKVLEAIGPKITHSAWFITATHDKNTIQLHTAKKAEGGLWIRSTQIAVEKIANDGTIGSFLFNNKTLRECLKELCREFIPLDLRSLNAIDLFNATDRYALYLNRRNVTCINTAINMIELHGSYIGLSNKKAARKALNQSISASFITWKRTPQHRNKKRRYSVSYINAESQVRTIYFKIHRSGLMEDSSGDIFDSFDSRKKSTNSLLQKYEDTFAKTLTIT